MESKHIPTTEALTKESAILQMNGIITQLGQFGGNDSEIPDIMHLIERVMSGDLEPVVALEEAQRIFNGKMGMHDSYR